MIRDIGAALLGIVIAVACVFLIEMLGHAVYPPPENLDFSDSSAMRAYVATLPLGALLFVLFAYVFGSYAGTRGACLLGRAKPFIYALIVGILMLVASITNLIMIPHPIWFAVAAVSGIVLASALGTYGRSARGIPQ